MVQKAKSNEERGLKGGKRLKEKRKSCQLLLNLQHLLGVYMDENDQIYKFSGEVKESSNPVELLRITKKNLKGADLYLNHIICNFLEVNGEDKSLVALMMPEGYLIVFKNKQISEALRPIVLDKRAKILENIQALRQEATK